MLDEHTVGPYSECKSLPSFFYQPKFLYKIHTSLHGKIGAVYDWGLD